MPLYREGLDRRDERSDDRLPPGQRHVKGWPVLHEGAVPAFDPEAWRLRVWGEVERLRWLEETMAELEQWVGRARNDRRNAGESRKR